MYPLYSSTSGMRVVLGVGCRRCALRDGKSTFARWNAPRHMKSCMLVLLVECAFEWRLFDIDLVVDDHLLAVASRLRK